MPGVWAGDDHPMCNDDVWVKLMKAVGAKAEFHTDRVGISYMLEGDANVNNADPYDTEPNPGEVWATIPNATAAIPISTASRRRRRTSADESSDCLLLHCPNHRRISQASVVTNLNLDYLRIPRRGSAD